MSFKLKGTASNYFYHTLYQVLTMLTPLITTPYISRVLQADGIGAYSYTYNIVQYFVIFGNLGFSTYGQIEIAKVNRNKMASSHLFWELFFLRLIPFSISCIVYGYLISCSSRYQDLFLILSGLMLSGIIDISWFYYGLNDYKSVSLRNVCVKIISILGIFIFVKEKNDVGVYTFILTMSMLAGSVVMWPKAKRKLERPIFRDFRLTRHIRPTLEFFIPSIATTIYTMADKTMIGLITQSAFENGYYEQAHKIEQIMVQFLLSVGVVMRSEMAALFHENKVDEIHRAINSAVSALLIISLPMCFGLIAVAQLLVECLFGTGFNECISLLKIFAILLVVISLSNCMSNMYLLVNNLQRKYAIGTYSGAAANLFLNALLISRYGAKGAAIASVMSETLILLMFYHFSKKWFSMKLYWKNGVKYLAASIVMAISVFLVNSVFKTLINHIVLLVIDVIIGILVYFIQLILLRDAIVFKYINIVKSKFIYGGK